MRWKFQYPMIWARDWKMGKILRKETAASLGDDMRLVLRVPASKLAKSPIDLSGMYLLLVSGLNTRSLC